MAVSVDQALSFYTKNRNKFPGMTASQAVDQIVRGGEIPVAAVEAAPAAPVAAGLAAAAPAPAPVPMAAPEPVAEVEDQPEAPPAPVYFGPNQAALRAYQLANPEAPASAPAAKNAPVDYAAMAKNAATKRELEGLNINAEIERTTTISPEMQKLIDDKLERYGIQLTQVDKDKQQATWMAVAQAGMKMAQSQSPYFMQALASGMEAGIDGYSEAKAKAAEKKARLQDLKEDLSIKAIELRDQAIEKAINARKDALQGAAAKTALESGSLGLIINQKTAAEQIRAPGLENAYKQAVTSKVYSDIATDKARLALARAAASPGGGGPSLKTSDVKAAIAGAASDNRLIAQRLENFIDPPSAAEKQGLKARQNVNNETIRQGNSILSGKIGVSNNNPLGVSTPWRK
jgi:hypothetical protein